MKLNRGDFNCDVGGVMAGRQSADPEETAKQMVDAVTWLSQVAEEVGFEAVAPDLLTAREKLVAIAGNERRSDTEKH